MSRNDNKYKKDESISFICEKCGKGIFPTEAGTLNRNHCPECLWSRHVDLRTGDRMSVCRGMMEPIGVWVKGKDEWAVIHRCVKCGFIRANRIAGDDSRARLMMLAVKPLVMLPFPFSSFNGDETWFGAGGMK